MATRASDRLGNTSFKPFMPLAQSVPAQIAINLVALSVAPLPAMPCRAGSEIRPKSGLLGHEADRLAINKIAARTYAASAISQFCLKINPAPPQPGASTASSVVSSFCSVAGCTAPRRFTSRTLSSVRSAGRYGVIEIFPAAFSAAATTLSDSKSVNGASSKGSAP